jgi:hypothetical protein
MAGPGSVRVDSGLTQSAPAAPLASQNITDPFNSANTQNCTYTHDDLGRIISVNCGANTWQQKFSYDNNAQGVAGGPFGNLIKSVQTGGTGNSFQATYNLATNQITTVGGRTDERSFAVQVQDR